MSRGSPLSFFFVIAGLFFLGEAALYGDPATKASPKLMDKLVIGGAVAVKDVGLAYEFTVWEGDSNPLGYRCVESTPEFVTLRDNAGISDKVIPWWSIKSVTIMRKR